MGEGACIHPQRATDVGTRECAGADPPAHDRLDGRDEVSLRVGDGFFQERAENVGVFGFRSSSGRSSTAASKITLRVTEPTTGASKKRLIRRAIAWRIPGQAQADRASSGPES